MPLKAISINWSSNTDSIFSFSSREQVSTSGEDSNPDSIHPMRKLRSKINLTGINLRPALLQHTVNSGLDPFRPLYDPFTLLYGEGEIDCQIKP